VRAVVQRVTSASVTVAGERIAEMREGLLVLVGVGQADEDSDALELARKLVHLRVFEDDQGKINESLLDTGGTLGLVSQFTLFGDTNKGRRPSFGRAAPADVAEPLVEALADAAREHGVAVVTGRFGATMEVELVNAGPLTLLLDTQEGV
jgi:D-tyrosyl-tRNA(Tyr) deacylase